MGRAVERETAQSAQQVLQAGRLHQPSLRSGVEAGGLSDGRAKHGPHISQPSLVDDLLLRAGGGGGGGRRQASGSLGEDPPRDLEASLAERDGLGAHVSRPASPRPRGRTIAVDCDQWQGS